MTFCQFISGTFGNVALGTHAASRSACSPSHGYPVTSEGHSPARRSQDLINRRRAPHLCGEYDVISIESEDMDMSIRGKSILTALAIMLIGTAPAWSQSLLKTLDPDNDGTVDKRELRGRLNAKDFAAADPDHDGTLDKNEFLALVEKRFNAANPDNDGTIDAKELKSSAGRSLVLLLK